MRQALLALATLTAIGLLAGPDAAQAQVRAYRYCLIEGGLMNAPGECSYSTYAQCMATASGRRAFCQLNPVYAFAEQNHPQVMPRKFRPHHHRKHRH